MKQKVLYSVELTYGNHIAWENPKDAVAFLELVNSKATQLKKLTGYGRTSKYQEVEPFSSDTKTFGVETIGLDQIEQAVVDTEDSKVTGDK